MHRCTVSAPVPVRSYATSLNHWRPAWYANNSFFDCLFNWVYGGLKTQRKDLNVSLDNYNFWTGQRGDLLQIYHQRVGPFLSWHSIPWPYKASRSLRFQDRVLARSSLKNSNLNHFPANNSISGPVRVLWGKRGISFLQSVVVTKTEGRNLNHPLWMWQAEGSASQAISTVSIPDGHVK